MAKELIGNGVSRSGDQNPQSPACESTLEASQNPPPTETTKEPPTQPETSATPRTSRADAKYQELLAQAREIMSDPEFMEEVMALVRLKMKLETELTGGSGATLMDVLRRSFRRRKK